MNKIKEWCKDNPKAAKVVGICLVVFIVLSVFFG
tara:strand:- start:1785 stop:1886 length:102 start_codon:yes stop_codon:yes gene_type:complete